MKKNTWLKIKSLMLKKKKYIDLNKLYTNSYKKKQPHTRNNSTHFQLKIINGSKKAKRHLSVWDEQHSVVMKDKK